jgi:hypothetical protein
MPTLMFGAFWANFARKGTISLLATLIVPKGPRPYCGLLTCSFATLNAQINQNNAVYISSDETVLSSENLCLWENDDREILRTKQTAILPARFSITGASP